MQPLVQNVRILRSCQAWNLTRPTAVPAGSSSSTGPSSSGKSTLAKAMRPALPEPFLRVPSDHLVASGMLPARRDPDGPFAWWQQLRPRFFDGFHRCLPALAAAGNDLIVEHVIEFRAWREYLARLLGDLDVFLVGVHCDVAEIDRRERIRGDRRADEGRSHVETNLIHTFGPYDFEVDTTDTVPGVVAASVLGASADPRPTAILSQRAPGNSRNLIRTCHHRTRHACADVWARCSK